VLDGAVYFAESASHTVFFFCDDSFHVKSSTSHRRKREQMTIKNKWFGCFCAGVSAFGNHLFSEFSMVFTVVHGRLCLGFYGFQHNEWHVFYITLLKSIYM
jgi:hypothetical protein